MRIGVIGAGKWGQALQFAMMQKQQEVLITSRTKREDVPFFSTLDAVLACSHIVISISTQHTDEWLKANFRFNGQKILVASKGIDLATHRFLNEIYEAFIPPENLAYLTGPSFAKEVKASLPTALVINSTNLELASEWMEMFPPFIKTYRSDDVIGAEIAGAYKNVIAIAAGVSDALNLGNNARAALITRGLAEMSRFGVHFGAKMESFLGLSGVGDLFLTASSTLSRNYRVGFGLGSGQKLDAILAELGEVAEGVPTASAIVEIAQERGIYTPIAVEVHKIIGGKPVRESIKDLLVRGAQEEFDGLRSPL
jgi:glycerol-3-phosphate dehydrogenase (NAD(P)+)